MLEVGFSRMKNVGTEHGMWGYPEQFMPVPGGAYIHPDASVEAARRRAPAEQVE